MQEMRGLRLTFDFLRRHSLQDNSGIVRCSVSYKPLCRVILGGSGEDMTVSFASTFPLISHFTVGGGCGVTLTLLGIAGGSPIDTSDLRQNTIWKDRMKGSAIG
jgi:hypothetical protein